MIIHFTWSEPVTISKIIIYWAHGNTCSPQNVRAYSGTTADGTFVTCTPGETQSNCATSDYAEFMLSSPITVTHLTCTVDSLSKWFICQRFWPMAEGSTCVHEWGAWTTNIPPTCVEAGERVRTCALCNSEQTEEIDALEGDHVWGAGVVTKEPTETQTGTRTYTCSRCGAVKTETIPATGNSLYLCPYVTSVVGCNKTNVLFKSEISTATTRWDNGTGGEGIPLQNNGYGSEAQKEINLTLNWAEPATVARVVIVLVNEGGGGGHIPSTVEFYADDSLTPIALKGDPVEGGADVFNTTVTYEFNEPTPMTSLRTHIYENGWLIFHRFWVYGNMGGDPPPPPRVIEPAGVIVF